MSAKYGQPKYCSITGFKVELDPRKSYVGMEPIFKRYKDHLSTPSFGGFKNSGGMKIAFNGDNIQRPELPQTFVEQTTKLERLPEINLDYRVLPPKPCRQPLMVQASSGGYKGGNYARIKVDGKQVAIEANDGKHHRGLHIVLINRTNGRIELAKCFDTYESNIDFDDFVEEHSPVPDGYIVVAACKDDCATNLSMEGRQWLSNLGSTEIWDLGYRQSFVFVGSSDTREGQEFRSEDDTYPVSLTQVFMVNAETQIGQT